MQKEIDGREYDICAECWDALAEKLRGKGRTKRREIVLLPPPGTISKPEVEKPGPLPGEPPKIWGTAGL